MGPSSPTRRRLAASGGAAVLAAVAALVPVAPVVGAGGSCGNIQRNAAGAQSNTFQTSVFGVRASIERKEPDLCGSSGGSPSDSSAWAMLIPRTPNDQYAQSGYARVGADQPGQTQGMHVFAQYSKACFPSCGGSSPVVNAYGPDPSGGATFYATYLRSADDRIHMYAGGTSLLEVNRDVSGEWSTDWAGQFAGEAAHTPSDIPGTVNDQVRFNYIQKYDQNGNLSFIQELDSFSTLGRYHRDVSNASVGGKNLNVWTNPL